jgi:hypothetical protein
MPTICPQGVVKDFVDAVVAEKAVLPRSPASRQIVEAHAAIGAGGARGKLVVMM